MAKLLDMYGNPIKRDALLQEHATPTLSGVRSHHSNNVSHGITPDKVARLLREADDGRLTSYLKLGEEIEEKEGHYHSVLGTRKRSVAQLEITVEAADDSNQAQKHADLVKAWLDRETLEAELVDILDAIGKGFSVVEIMWDTSGSVWLPADLEWKDPSWFEFCRTDGKTLYMRSDTDLEDLPSYKYIIHTHKAKSGLTRRGGVMRPVLWMYLFKTFSIKDWVIFAETYGQPIRIGQYGTSASDDDKAVLLRAVANIGSDAAAIIPDSMNIDFVESQNKAQTSDVYEKLIRLCDEQTSKIVLGQTMTTDNGSSKSQAEVHNEVKHDIERSDAKQLAATLNAQLIKPIIDLNFGMQKAYPRIRIGCAEYVDIEKTTKAADLIVRMGAKISQSDLLSKTGFKPPESDDDALTLERLSPARAEQPATSNEVNVEASRHDHAPSPLDNFVDELGEDWEELLTPTVEEIERIAEGADSYEDLIAKLLQASPNMSLEAAAEAIGQANFNARIGGELDVEGVNDER